METVAREKPRILVVDDDRRDLAALEGLLTDRFDVVAVDDPAEADQRLDDARLSVILSDQSMPRMSGAELLRRASARSDATRLLMTAYQDLDAVAEAINDGHIFGFIRKPIDTTELVRLLETSVENHRLRRELVEERRLLRTLLESSPDWISFKDADRRFLRCSRTCGEMLGLEHRVDAVGRREEDLAATGRPGDLGELEDEVLRTGVPLLDRLERSVASDGVTRWHSVSRAPLRSEDGATLGLLEIGRDVTERQRLEARFHAVFEDAPIGIVNLDAEGRFLDANPAFQRMLGWSGEELRSKTVADVLYPDDRAGNAERLARLARRGERQLQCVERYVHRDGHAMWARVTASAVHDASGRFQHTVSMIQDVTDFRRLEEQFLHAQRMEAVGRLAGGVAHDFNNLLTAIGGFAELVASGGRLGESDLENLRQVDTLVERGARLTRQLLAVSRRQALRKERLDAGARLRDSASILGRLLGEIVRLELTTPAEPLWVEADASQLDQVLMNLAVNARDAMPDGGRLRLAASAVLLDERRAAERELPAGRYVEITVSDTGSGIPAEVLPRIFEPFFTTKAERGTGLGLSTVYGIVRQHGGAIGVVSSPEGTTFTVSLPEAEASRPAPSLPGSVATRAPTRGGGLVLLVDDNEPIRRVLAQSLATAGFRVLTCATAAEAFAAARTAGGIDLLVTDLGLPDERGSRLYTELLRRHPGLPVVFITGYLGDASDELPAVTTLTEFLPKPFTRDALLERMEAVLARARDH